MEVPVYNLAGEVVKQIQISDDVFAVPFNKGLVHQAMVRQRANARHGTASTKTRGEVAGSGRKLFQQKHTGRARAGDLRSPLRRHGGIVFGPRPRSYEQDMPRSMRRAALKCVLSTKAQEGLLKIVEALPFEEPKTKRMVEVLAALGAAPSALVATAEPEENVIKSARNVPGVKTLPARLLNVVDLLSYQTLLMTEAAVHKAEEIWGGKGAPLRGVTTTADN